MALTQTLADNFNDNSTNLTLWAIVTDGVSIVAESSQQLNLSLAANAVNSFAGYVSNATYDLTSSFSQVQLVAVSSGAVDTTLELEIDDSNKIGWTQNNGTLFAFYATTALGFQSTSVAYNASVHKWLRVRESGGTTFWDYSINGINWTNLKSIANPIAVTSLLQSLVTFENNSTPAPGTAIFDNFNILPPNFVGSMTFSGTLNRQ